MKKDQNIRQLLQRWLRGDAGHAEERELGTLAQDDPFLADALEGYQELPAGEHTDKVDQLRKRLQEKKPRRKIMPLAWRVAAGAAIVVAAVFALQWMNRGEEGRISEGLEIQTEETADRSEKAPRLPQGREERRQNMEREDQQREDEKEMIEEEVAASPVEEEIRPAEEVATPAISGINEPGPAEKRKRIIVADEPPAKEAKPAVVSPKMEKNVIADDIAIVEEAPAKADVDAGISQVARAQSLPPKAPARQISGVITNDEGEPLIGVTVNVDGTSIGTVTDFDGRFNIPVDSGRNELQISYTGYQSTKIPVIQNDTYNIRLQNKAFSLDEVVVSGFESKQMASRKKDSFPGRVQIIATGVETISTEGAFPKGGQKQLNKTVKRNALPITGETNLFGKSVGLSFLLNTEGELTNITITESLSPAFDAEAIRLLKLTKWKLDESHKQTGARVSCKIHF